MQKKYSADLFFKLSDNEIFETVYNKAPTDDNTHENTHNTNSQAFNKNNDTFNHSDHTTNQTTANHSDYNHITTTTNHNNNHITIKSNNYTTTSNDASNPFAHNNQHENIAFLTFEKYKLQIIDNIRQILGTQVAPMWHQHPFVQLPFAFGMKTNVLQYMDEETVESIKISIIDAIEKYEKRVKQITCTINSDANRIMNLIVNINCVLDDQPIAINIVI